MAGHANQRQDNRDRKDICSILSSQGIEFLISSKEARVPLSSINHQNIFLYFSANWCRPCKTFTPQLVHIYNTLNNTGRQIEIIFVSLDRDENGFQEHLKSMPWLATPFNVSIRRRLCEIYHANYIPSLIPLNAIGEDAVLLIEDYGTEAFPFTKERKEELKDMDNKKRLGGNIQDLLACGKHDFVIAGDGQKTLVSELIGKTVGLFFGAYWCPPSRGFNAQLADAYKDLKLIQNKCFEIIYISTDRNEEEFNLNVSTMPWLAIPYKENKTRQDLARIFKVGGIPTFVIIGPDGKVVTINGRAMITSYGAKAFPFTTSRIAEVEALLRMEGDGLPQQVKDKKHGHLLKLDMAKAYVCDSCKRQGKFWVYTCGECDFDLHPTCTDETTSALLEGVKHG